MDNLLTPTAFAFGILPFVLFLGMAFIYAVMFSLLNNRVKILKGVIESQKELLGAQEVLIESLDTKAKAFEKLSATLEDKSSRLESQLSDINTNTTQKDFSVWDGTPPDPPVSGYHRLKRKKGLLPHPAYPYDEPTVFYMVGRDLSGSTIARGRWNNGVEFKWVPSIMALEWDYLGPMASIADDI